MKHTGLILTVVSVFLNWGAMGQNSGYDVFIPIGKYLSCGDTESLGAWFAPTLEITIFDNAADCSKNQAKQILKSFFKSYTPRAFEIMHQAGRENFKYAIGNLTASGEHLAVTIFVSSPVDGSFQIQQLKIDRME